MSKTQKWPARAFYLVIAVVLALGLLLTPATNPNNVVSADQSEWVKYGTPSMGDWVVAPEFVINFPAAGAGPGGLVHYVVGDGHEDNDPDKGTGAQLLESKDGGATWKSLTDNVLEVDEIGALDYDNVLFQYVACAPDDADFLIVVVQDTDTDKLYVVGSTDGGDNFGDTGDLEDGGTELTAIFDLAISKEIDGNHNIALGGSGSSVGLIYRMESGAAFGGHWVDASAYDDWDMGGTFTSVSATSVAFAPSFLKGDTVLATTHTAAGATYLQTGVWGTKNAWNETAGRGEAVLITDVGYVFLGKPTDGIALPFDYEGKSEADRVLWVYVNVANPELVDGSFDNDPGAVIFRVDGDTADHLEGVGQISGNPLLASISYFGSIESGKAIAGLLGAGTLDASGGVPADCCEGVQVYRNDGIEDMDICCERWHDSCKPPTGRMAAGVSFVAPDKAIAVVIGGDFYDESAFSVSYDDGESWNQVGLVNTDIDYLSDVAKSPDCNKTFLTSVNLESGCGCDSLWLKADTLSEAEEYSGKWVRVWCKPLVNGFGLLRLAPEETDGKTVYLIDRGTDTVYYNSTEGLACWDTGTSTIDEIVDLAVESESTIYALGSDAKVSKSINHGDAWEIDDEESVDSEVDDGWTIAVFGTGEAAEVLVGGMEGKVSYSSDAGETFTALKDIDTSGYVTVAFDSYFTDNSTIYAAVIESGGATGNNGIYRWVIDQSDDEWKNLNAEDYGYTGLVLDRADGNPMTDAEHGGVLYASYVTTNEDDEVVTGVARCLTPAKEVCCGEANWDYLVSGLTPDEEAFYFMPKALKICGCLTADSNSKLWVIDGIGPTGGPSYDIEEGKDGTVWTYEDCFAKAGVTPTVVADGATVAADPCECANEKFVLAWERLCNACEYEFDISLDSAFTQIVLDEAGYTPVGPGGFYDPPKNEVPSVVIAQGDLDCNTTYYWRVRSHYAETDETIASWWSDVWSFTVAAGPSVAIDLSAPEPGASDVAIKNVGFTWSSVADATSYDFVLSSSADLSSPLESKTGLTGTAYTCTTELENSTSYFWQVTAMKDSNIFSQSDVSTFTTAPLPPVTPLPAEPTTPPWVWVVIGLGAVLVIVVIVLIFRTRRV